MSSLFTKQKSISNFLALLFIVSLLAIDFFPYFKSMEIINPQFLYLSIVNLIFGIYLYFNRDHVSEDIISVFKKSYVLKIYAVFLFLCGLSYFTSKNTSLFLTKYTEIIIVFCLIINLSILLKNKLDLLYKIVFIVCISAFLQSWQQLCHFIIIPKKVSILELLYNMKGNTGNINILAASLTIKVPFLLLGIIHFKSFKRLFLLIVLFSVTAVIFLTGARTPLINLSLIYIVYIVYLLKENSFHKSAFIKIITLIIPVLLSVLFTNNIFEKSKENSRYVSLEDRVKQINTEDASANARLNFWKNTIKITKTSPITGIGLGNYQVESIPYEKYTANDFNVSLHAHNDFLEICAETGIVNCLVYLSLFVFIFIINAKRILQSKNTETKSIAILTLLMLIVYGIDSVFNFPMYRPTMQIFFGLLLVFTIINSEFFENQYFVTKPISKLICLSFIIISLITSFSAFLIYKASNLEYMIVADDINNKQKGDLTGDEVVRRISKYPNTLSSSEAFYEYAAIYYIREKNYDKAMSCFYKASKINPYSGRINFFKHVIANHKGNVDSAYTYIKQAFYLRPRNIDFYRSATQYAGIRQDTLEILKEQKIFSKYRQIPEAWNIASVSLQKANYKGFTDFINQGLKQYPKDSILLKQRNVYVISDYITKGQNYVSKGKLEMGLKTYQEALKLDPENIYVMQNIGFYYYNLGKNQQAITYFLNALKKKGLENGKTEFLLGICYLKINDKKNACKYFSLSKDKNFIDAQLLKQYCEVK